MIPVMSPTGQHPRTFGQLPRLEFGDDFDESLPEPEIGAWEGIPVEDALTHVLGIPPTT